MIAYDENLNVDSITEVMKAILTNESELLKVSGRGKIWIQSKDKIEFKKN